jgi:propane 2-monooxygenase small subunit
MLTGDETHGTENVETLNGWLAAWTGDAVSAARQLQPIWSQLSEKVVRFEDSFDRSRGRFESLVGDIGLEAPKEVTA